MASPRGKMHHGNGLKDQYADENRLMASPWEKIHDGNGLKDQYANENGLTNS